MRIFAVLALIVSLVFYSGAVVAQESNQDLQTDVGGKAYTPFTTPEGVFQIETDIGNFSQTNYGNYSQRIFQTFDPVIKYGLSNTVDIEASIGGYENVYTSVGKTVVRLSGFGDITPRIRWTFLTTNSFYAGVIVGVKIPTASTGIGNGQVEYNLIVPIQYDLPNGFTLQSSPEIDILNNASGTGKQFNYFGDISISHDIFIDNLSAFVEFAGQHATDAHTKDEYTADTGAEYQINPTSIITASFYFGLNQYSPAFQTIISVAKRF